MQTITLKVEDGFYDAFMQLLQNISKDKIEIIEEGYPSDMIVSSVEEVRRRVYEAEARIENGEFLTEEEYRKEMDAFLKTL